MGRLRARAALLCVQLVGYAAGCAEESASVTLGKPEASDAKDSGSRGMTDAGVRADAGAAADAVVRTDARAIADAGAVPAADYARAENWLCRPDNNEACDVDLDTTIVRADGTLELEPFTAASNPQVDCFYVYPTVSLDETPNSDLVPGPEELAVVRAQFARFAQHCRLYAPMYRQITLTALRATIAGQTPLIDRALGYNDVKAAWKSYLKNDNKGRGVILVAHSQGSGLLTQLIKEEIDPDPSKTPLIAAFLMGTNITVPEGALKGGSFQNVPVCSSAEELGCVIGYATFRADAPPPANSRFGKTTTAGQHVVCANPAALAGGSAELHAYLSRDGAGASGLPMHPWLNGDGAEVVKTPFVSVPGMLEAECKQDDNGSYLALTVRGDPKDPRTDDIVGDVVTNGQTQADWGLHLIDVHVGMGNLLELAHAKAQAFLAR